MTECIQSSFEFARHCSRAVVARFDAGILTSDAGALLLRQVDQRIRLLSRLARCFTDYRRSDRCDHSVSEMVAQRVYALALGYADLNDHDQLRKDPLMGLLAGRRETDGDLASKSTLCRLERTPATGAETDRYKKIRYQQEAVDRLLVDLFLEAHPELPEEIVIDLDTTDTPLHGHQEGRFFHGFYNEYCYLPLYIFCGEQLLGVRLREANQDASAGSREEIERIVMQIRERWPQVRIILRADSGFCREELMGWCEQNRVDYVFGLARNKRLRKRIEKAMRKAAARQRREGGAVRAFTAFRYRTRRSWSRTRRVAAKAEQLEGKENPRYVVTSLPAQEWQPRELYEDLYCARGEMENRIKEQMNLFAHRMSAETMRANQLRLYLAGMAYVLMEALRRLGLKGTEMGRAQVQTIQLRLLKIGARIRITARKVWISMASSYPWQALYRRVWANLSG